MNILCGWAAGIIDGEGSITARRLTRDTRKGWSSLDLRVSVSMSHRRTIYKLRHLFGVGSILAEKRRPHCKQMYRWVCTTQQAAQVLMEMLPWLVTKKKQALVLLDLAWEMRGKTSGRVINLRRRSWQDRRITKLKELNHV